MKFKWKIIALIGLLCIPNLYGMQQAQQPIAARESSPDFLYRAGTNAAFSAVMHGKEAIIPSLSRFVFVDFVSHALCKLMGFTRVSQQRNVESLVNFTTGGVMNYAQMRSSKQQPKPSFLSYAANYLWPSLMRAMVIDFCHKAFTRTTGADYPGFLRNNWPFAMVLPFCTLFAKEIIWGTCYEGLTSLQRQ